MFFRLVLLLAALCSCASGHGTLTPQTLSEPPEKAPLAPPPAGNHLLLVGESGSKGGVIALYKAPFDGKPQLVNVEAARGERIAPNGDLIAVDAYKGVFVFDPPFKRGRLHSKGDQFNGQILFDSKERLILPSRASSIVIVDPPYLQRSVRSFAVPVNIEQVAIDAHDDVFVGTQRTISGSAPTYECKPPTYYTCVDLRIGNGAAAIDSSGDLLTGISLTELAVFPSPYKHPKAKAKVPFGFYWLTAAHSGDIFVAGINPSGVNYFGFFSASIKGRFKRLPIDSISFLIQSTRSPRIALSSFQRASTKISAYALIFTLIHTREN